jgi:hypothetical protein
MHNIFFADYNVINAFMDWLQVELFTLIDFHFDFEIFFIYFSEYNKSFYS